MQEDVNVLREVIRQLRDELHRMKANNDQTGPSGAYATGWSARRSLNLLRFSLNRPMMLPHVEDDSDEEMEIVDTHGTMPDPHEETCVCSPERTNEDTDVNMEDEAFETVDKDKTEMSSARRSEVALNTENGEYTPSGFKKLPNDAVYRKQEDTCLSMQPSENSENTPDKPTYCVEDGAASDLSIVPVDVSPVLKLPTPSVSPRLDSSRKSLRTLSTLTASQSFPTKSNVITENASNAKTSNSICMNSLSNRRSCFASTEHLAATLHRGLEIIESQRVNPALRRSSFRYSCIPVVKVNVGVQTIYLDEESMDKGTGESICSRCKTKNYKEELATEDDGQNMQLVPVNGSPSNEKCKKQVPKVCQLVTGGTLTSFPFLNSYHVMFNHLSGSRKGLGWSYSERDGIRRDVCQAKF